MWKKLKADWKERILARNNNNHYIYIYALKSMTPSTSDNLSEKEESVECCKCIDNLL